MKLHGYFRSSASYRVRIALNLKGIAYEDAFHHLRHREHRGADYLALNPQGLVPALETEGTILTQSLAICEYLDETHPDPPLLPADPVRRAKVRAFAQVIACDVHPIQNLKILERVKGLGQDQQQVNRWAAEVIEEGLAACEKLITDEPGPYCFGEQVSLADILLVPQLANGRRFGARLDFPRLIQAEAACLELEAFHMAAPENQPDAEK